MKAVPRSWRAIAIGVLLAGCVATGRSSTSVAAPVFSEDFDGPKSADRVRLLRTPTAEIVEGEGVNGTRALRMTYIGNDHGSEGAVGSMPLPKPGPEFTLNYDVKFDRDFQFVLGGKLHGLGPLNPIAGGKPGRPDGWSARVMWREGGKAETYTYHQDQRGEYGDAGRQLRPFRFALDRYYAVSLHVKVNEPASRSNGFVRLYIDGTLIERKEPLRLRSVDTPDSLVAKFLFSTFHGGHDPSWAPRRPDGGYADVHAFFDDFAIYPGEHVRRQPGG